MIYAVVELGGKIGLQEEIYDAINAGDWYSEPLAALATADQYNQYMIDRISEEAYVNGDFTLLGVVKLGDEGLVTSHSN
ncbi:hypothetical protein HWB05_gp054 [Streptomyces phage BRock]|uniref:Uncharacterized protein n=1 Tax=Streptomyces phage BRock TaxID=1913591 RepID=A0A1J0GVW5_9CAUD|nr:hypothetical protein HWB05_gp054 [Streptomyces phage BRock]APC46316.2 hypothetical protein [Streptomyces phage BRock]